METVTLLSLPAELLQLIVIWVAKSSLKDLLTVKLSCKTLCTLACQECVYTHVCLDNIPIDVWDDRWERHSKLLRKCFENNNPEALYRAGVKEYFGRVSAGFGMTCLEQAGSAGHLGALYAKAIIFILTGREELKQKAVRIMSDLKPRKGTMKKLRMKFVHLISCTWIHNPAGMEHPSSCCSIKEHKGIRDWLSSDDGDGDGDDEHRCTACICDYEAKQIWLVLPHVCL